jgi:hypothetical protein
MKKWALVSVASVLMVLLMLSGCTSIGPKRSSEQQLRSFNSENWQTECGALVQALADLAPKEVNKIVGKEVTVDKQFMGKEVTWELDFMAFERDKNGKESLRFDLDPAGIRYRFFSGKPVMMSFKPAAGTWDSWTAIKRGSRVRITGLVGQIFFATMTPSDNPSKHIPVAMATIENVKLAESKPR